MYFAKQNLYNKIFIFFLLISFVFSPAILSQKEESGFLKQAGGNRKTVSLTVKVLEYNNPAVQVVVYQTKPQCLTLSSSESKNLFDLQAQDGYVLTGPVSCFVLAKQIQNQPLDLTDNSGLAVAPLKTQNNYEIKVLAVGTQNIVRAKISREIRINYVFFPHNSEQIFYNFRYYNFSGYASVKNGALNPGGPTDDNQARIFEMLC